MGRTNDNRPIPKSERREATRAALIAAAYTVANRGGADPLDPAIVTAEVGTSRPLFYAHFPTRADFVEAILASIHEDAARIEGAAAAPSAQAQTPRDAILSFFGGLSAPLDRHAALARAVIPASHLPGPLAVARSRRRARAVVRIAEMLPATLPLRAERAAFLMDAFLGVQLAWSKALAPESLADRVRRDLAFALDGVCAASAPNPLSHTSPNEEIP